MSAMVGRVDLREIVGRSLNSSSLTIAGRAPSAETPLQRVGALGLAALHIHHGADRLGVPVATVVSRPAHVPDRRDVIAADLARNLWHIAYARQHEAVPKATELFAEWMSTAARVTSHFEKHGPTQAAEQHELLRRFAVHVLHEWLSDRCIACGGSGKLERSRTGSWVRPRGSMQRNAVFRVCPACHGSRRQAPSHGARARALEITNAQYEHERWAAHFTAAQAWLNSQILRLMRPLTIQLERGRKRG
ncbi:MAG: hypothetical protein EPO27_10525 [Betaproteobacteria bacterium]|nr:MAG: hypothetical protein EPO27_10525 [Betaproteobacteria bacterium]